MAGILHKIGHIIRETGQALDRVGCRLQGNNAFLEEGEGARIHEGHLNGRLCSTCIAPSK